MEIEDKEEVTALEDDHFVGFMGHCEVLVVAVHPAEALLKLIESPIKFLQL